MTVIIDINHEAGDLSEYDSTVTDGGDLSAHADAALASSNYGLKCVIDDTTSIYGGVNISSLSTDFRLRFYFDPNSLTMDQFEAFNICYAYLSGSPWTFCTFEYRAVDAINSVRHIIFQPYDDSGSLTSDTIVLTDQPHYIEMYVHRATNDSSADGTVEWWVDGVSQGSWASVDNYDSFALLNLIRFGAVIGLDAGTSGTFYIDEIKANDDGSEIGPVINRYWVGSDSSWNTAANWSTTSGGSGGAGVPGSINAVIFDSGDVTNCTCDVAIDIASIDVQSGYSGTLDFADSAYAHACSGDMTFDGTDTVDCGTATITCGGNFDMKDQSTFIGGTSTVIMTGTSKELVGTYAGDGLNDIEIDGTITVGASSNGLRVEQQASATLTINENKTYTIPSGYTHRGRNYEIAGTLDGAGTAYSTNDINIASTGNATVTAFDFNGVTISLVLGAVFNPSTITAKLNATINSGTYGGIWTFTNGHASARSVIFNGTITFTGEVIIDANYLAGYTVDNSSNPDLTFQSDFSVSETVGTITWTKGTGTISFEGTADQDIDFNDESVEDIEIDKTSGTVTLTGGVETDSFLLTDGTFDIDGNNLDTIANFTQAADTTINDTTGGGLITIGVNFAINGSSGNECIWNGPDLDITGTAAAAWTTVTDSDASAGTEVTATDNCTDVSGNFGWDFGVGVTLLPIKFNQQHRIFHSGIYRSSFNQIPNIRFGLFEAADVGSIISLLSNLINTSDTLNIESDIVRAIKSILLNTSISTDIDKIILRNVLSTLTGSSATSNSDISLAEIIQFVSNIITISATQNIDTIFLRNIFSAIINSSSSTSANKIILRNIISEVINLSDTSDATISILGIYFLVANIINSSTSSTIDHVTFRVLAAIVASITDISNIEIRTTREILSNLINISSTTDIDPSIANSIELIAAIANESLTVNIDILKIRSILTEISGLSSTTALDYIKEINISVNLLNISNTSSIQKVIERLFNVSLENNTLTPTDVVIILGTLVIAASDILSVQILQNMLDLTIEQNDTDIEITQNSINIEIN